MNTYHYTYDTTLTESYPSNSTIECENGILTSVGTMKSNVSIKAKEVRISGEVGDSANITAEKIIITNTGKVGKNANITGHVNVSDPA